MDPAKTQRIVDWPRPRNVTEVNRFVGMVQYYRRYIPNLSTIMCPLNHIKKKNVAFVWKEEQEASFKACKEALVNDVLLVHPDFTKPFVLYTDASDVGLGGVLSQAEGSDPEVLRPVYFGSKALNEQEKRISIYEKEFLAIVYFIHLFKVYLLGHHFTVYTDQRSLQFLIKFNEEASAKLVRWQASLMAYDFDIIYRPGKVNVNTDALSRLQAEYSQGPDLEDIMTDYYLPLNMIRESENQNVKRRK
ncbi:hypothetical protein G6F37_010104 [Rhizopus arrhizus]|nr:hypothetical protein G6F38_011725 [Rhizopus arrhizus]KAG1153718.1 hypothetical protein G6F37_010104 [Rhizopus arrhizus]